MVTTPRKNEDLRHFETTLTAEERRDAILECKLFRALNTLGKKWLLHPEYNGHYTPELHARIAR